MDEKDLNAWRKRERERLVAARLALDAAQLRALRTAIDAHLERAFPGLAQGTLGLCWPYRNEYDARFLARRLRARGAQTALPVVLGPRQPLEFRLWAPGVALARGVYDIPYPAHSPAVRPGVLLLPMNGFDAAGFRLGYGGGYFDRTLSAMRASGSAANTVAIGVGYECARLPSIHPQEHDIPMDYVVTERGVYARGTDGLALLEAPKIAPAPAGYSSPACLAHEIAPDYYGPRD